MCQKSPKRDAFSLFQSETPFSIMKESHPHSFQVQRRQKACVCSLQSSAPWWQTKKRRDKHTHTHTDSQNKERSAHSKFKFQIQIMQKRTQGSERCYAPRRRIEKNWVGCAFHRYHTTLRAFKIWMPKWFREWWTMDFCNFQWQWTMPLQCHLLVHFYTKWSL